jgi:hypothetical protein
MLKLKSSIFFAVPMKPWRFQDIANHIKKSRDEAVEIANALREKGIIYFDVNLKYLRVNGDTMGVRLINAG